MKIRLSRLAVGLLALAALASPPTAPAQNQKTTPEILAVFRPVVEKASESTVRILCEDKEVALGTVVEANGLIVTKFSQLKEKVVVKTRDGKTFDAKLIGIEDPHDLAFLKIDARDLKPVEWKDSDKSAQGDWVASPGMDKDPAAIGVVSVPSRKVPPSPPIRLPPPNSGYMGVIPAEDTDGVKLSEVSPNTPASRAGLRTNDVVVAINGKPVKTPDELIKAVQAFKVDDEITIKYKRGEETKEAKVKLAKRPASRGDFQDSMGSTLSDRRTGFPNILQHDQVLKHTDCGGPLVDLDGKVVGINVARAGRVQSWAVPSKTVQALMADFKAGKLTPERYALTKKVERTKLQLRDLEDSLKQAQQARADAKKAIGKAEEDVNQAKNDEDADALEKAETALKAATAREKSAGEKADKVKAQIDQATRELEKAEKELKAS